MLVEVWRWFASLIFGKQLDICIVGLPNAGKTSFVHVLTDGEFSEQSPPTVGYNLRQLRKGSVTMKLWDIGYVVTC